jgi:adenylate cyclase, class 2
VPVLPADLASPQAPRRNVELKARDADHARSLAVCLELGAEDHGELCQRDTYFAVSHGGLKLRDERPGRPHLIQVQRADQAQERESRYRIVEVDDADTLVAALDAALGVRGAVEKRRRLLLWRDVRIHLDAVEGLGTFLELEAVALPHSDLTLEHERVATLREALGITDDRLVPVGYAALLGL